jgi:hypothetical protein
VVIGEMVDKGHASSVLIVVKSGEPGGQSLDGCLELGVEVDESAKLLGQPFEADLFLAPARCQLLDAAICEVHACEVIARAPRKRPRPEPRLVCRVWPEDVPVCRVAGLVCRVWPEDVPGVTKRWPLQGPDCVRLPNPQRSKALAISSPCCSACFLLDPVAGEAEGARDATCSARVSPRLASA